MTAKIRLAILISGRGSNMESLIRACHDPDYPAAAALVVSNDPAAPGLKKAALAAIPVAVIDSKALRDRSAFESKLDTLLKEHHIDLICLAGFMKILSPYFISLWPDRILNIHPSLLPAYPGLDIHRRVLADGQLESGCTVHYVTPEVDAGPIVVQRSVTVKPGDTPETLAARVLEQEHTAYPQAVKLAAEKLLKSHAAGR